MKLFDIDWADFIERLPVWKGLTPAARRAFLKLTPSAKVRSPSIGRSARQLVKAGMVAPLVGRKEAVVSKEFGPFLRVMRAMDRHRLYEQDRGAYEMGGSAPPAGGAAPAD